MTVPAAVPLPTRPTARGRALVLVVTAVVGFLLVSQLRGQERFADRLEAESEGDLARILADLTKEADSLRDEIATLRVQLADLEASSRNDDAAARSAQELLSALQVLAATVPVTGPGIVVDVDDPDDSVRYDNLIDVVQELRDAGAEAVAVNNRRLGVTSAFSEQDGVVTLDDAPLAPPYRILAIGQPETLEGGLQIPGGAFDTLSSLKGVTVRGERSSRLDLPALQKAPTFKVARPVGSGS